MPSEPVYPDAPTGGGTVYRGDGSPMRIERGGDSGRIVDSDGEIAFVLGSLGQLNPIEMTTGEYIELSKIVDLTDYDTVSMNGSISADDIASGVDWKAQILIDETLLGELNIVADRARGLTDLKVPVRRYEGEHCVAFRLTLVEE